MRIVQLVVWKLVSLVLMVMGALLGMMLVSNQVLVMVSRAMSEVVLGPYSFSYGVAFFLLGMLGLLPWSRKKTANAIVFAGTHGEVTIELDSVEATLNRAVAKLPVVRKIRARVTPSEDRHHAEVRADVWIYKPSEASSAKEIVQQIEDHLEDSATSILGVEEVRIVQMNVRGISLTTRALGAPHETAAPDPPKAQPAPEPAAPVEEVAVDPEPKTTEEPVTVIVQDEPLEENRTEAAV